MLKTLSAPPVETTVGSHFVSNYPPFSCWTPDEIPKLEAVLNRPMAATEPISLYLHVPFCRQRFHYCYFRVYPRRSEEDVDFYIDKVLEELALYRERPAIGARAIVLASTISCSFIPPRAPRPKSKRVTWRGRARSTTKKQPREGDLCS